MTELRLELRTYATGYFGIAGGPESRNLPTHVVRHKDRQPICGVKVGKQQTFAWTAAGIHEPHVECKRCLKMIPKERAKLAKAEAAVAAVENPRPRRKR